MSKHKIKRIERVLGYTKASHKGAVIYFSKEKEYPVLKQSLKRKKVCKFTKGEHQFILMSEKECVFLKGVWKEYKCELCGKKWLDW